LSQNSRSALDHLPEPRKRLLLRLKLGGPSTIAAIAEDLETTGEAVRQQLLLLVRDGLVVYQQATSPRAAGRPATTYRLSTTGENLFPRRYDDLVVQLVDAVREELSEEALVRLLARLTDARVRSLEPQLAGLDLAHRVEALASLYQTDDPFLTTEAVEGGFRIRERNCPFLDVALKRPLLCSCTVSTLTRVLEHEVEREERFQNGDGCCVFRVHADRPVDVSRLRFVREPEPSSSV
jgi:predicted ArsR family transcriptional regulator